MKFFKKFLILIIVLLLIFINTGCWNYREIEALGLVAGVAVDRNPTNNNYILTVQILNTESTSTQNLIKVENYTEEGETIFFTVRKIIQIVGKKLYWSHAKVLILSTEIAREGLSSTIDWFIRDSEPRPNMWILISREKTAKEILINQSSDGKATAFILNKIIESHSISHRFVDNDLWRFSRSIITKDIDTLAPGVSLYKENSSRTDVIVEDTAVFSKDKLVGWLVGGDNIYLELLRNTSVTGIIRLLSANNTKTNITLEFFDNKTFTKPEYKNGQFTINILLKPVIAIDEISSVEDAVDKNSIKFQRQVNAYMEQRITNFILKSQKKFNADIFGYKKEVMIKYPAIWKRMSAIDPDIFNKFNFSVKVDSTIKGSGKTNTPLKPQE